MILWFVNALLVLVVLLLLLKPLLAKPRAAGRDGLERELIADRLAERLAELGRERAAGLIAEDEYAQARRETEAAYEACAGASGKQSLRTPVAGAAVVFASVAGAAFFYFYSSDGYRMVLAEQRAAEVVESFEATTAALERRLAEQPHDAEARRLLAISKYLLGDYAAAAAEYRLVAELGSLAETDDWIRYADALLRLRESAPESAPESARAEREAQGGRIIEALDAALASDPAHQRALFFSGMLHFDLGGYPQATERWRRLLALMPSGDSGAEELRGLIARAQNEGRETGGAGGAVQVAVSLSAELSGNAAPDDVVYVYARAVNGPPMPLAVARLRVSELPAEVLLGKDNAMMEGASLAAFERLEVVARVSKQGGAKTQPGDLIGSISPVAPGQAVAVEISTVVE